ncbi:DUF3293 domain-containing protein [Streptomyces glomeratus]|uniref:DUF3293 domain-containing protein n=1 Tax=Streptomyces glomeratus TaxID=284452 RepID=A0ABP6LLX2_9ACTN|nr:DUF3293 domain-containing protein [Streptomyces glomeratus]MCF1510495.1 DUF3293 domain-containing protein [Streptomyces glomeratus]
MHATDATGTPGNWDLYRTAIAHMQFQDRTVRVEPGPWGTAEGLFPESAGSRTVHVITAWNPRGRTASADDNARAHGLLVNEIRSRALTWWSAEGGDAYGTHREESVAVVGLSDAGARELGRRFGQDAIFAWTPHAWRVLACDSETAAVSGWAACESGRRSSLRPSGDAGRDLSDESSERHLGES